MTPSPDYDAGPTPMTDTNTAAALSAEADGWIEWHGGENPVPGARVDVRCRDGLITRELAGVFQWSHSTCADDRYSDIIAYRVATPAPAALEGSSSGEVEASLGRMRLILAEVEEGVPAICDSPLFASYEFAADFKRVVEYAAAARRPVFTSLHGLWKDLSLSRLERVKAHRTEFGSNLKEAVEAVDEEESRQFIASRAALQPSSAADAKPVAEPEGWLIERLEGRGYGPARRIVDAQQYDPTSPDHWISDEAQQRHRVTALYAQPAGRGAFPAW